MAQEEKKKETSGGGFSKLLRVIGYIAVFITSTILGVALLTEPKLFGLDLSFLSVFYTAQMGYVYLLVCMFGLMLVFLNHEKTSSIVKLLSIIGFVGVLIVEFKYQIKTLQLGSLLLNDLSIKTPNWILELVDKVPIPMQGSEFLIVVLIVAAVLIILGQGIKRNKLFAIPSVLIGFGLIALGLGVLLNVAGNEYPNFFLIDNKIYPIVQYWSFIGAYGLIAVGSAFGSLTAIF